MNEMNNELDMDLAYKEEEDEGIETKGSYGNGSRSVGSVQIEENSQKSVDVSSFLYDEAKITAELSGEYYRVPFAGSNLPSLEEKMNGGLLGGRLYVLGSIPSFDKTIFLNNIADNVCLNGYPVLFFSYDVGRLELFFWTLVRFSQYEMEGINKGILKDFEALAELFRIPVVKEIMGLKYVVDEMVFVDDWDRLIEQIRNRHGKGPVILVDYLRKLKTKQSFVDERLRVDELILKLNYLAKRFNVPFLVVSELARNAYKYGPKFSLGSFKESGIIEYEASWLGIWDEDENLIIFKAERGTGQLGRSLLKLDRNKMTFMDRNIAMGIKETFSKFRCACDIYG